MHSFRPKGGRFTIFTGKFFHALDAKNRLFVPAKFREELGVSFVMTLESDGSLVIYSRAEWEKFAERISARPTSQTDDLVDFYFSNAADMALDSQGRIVVPPDMREYAGIDKNVAVVGALRCIKVWSEERWVRRQASLTMEKISSAKRELEL